MVDPCKNESLQVINFHMLKKCIQANFPKGEAGRLTKEEGLPYHEVKEIRIEYSRILRIDHLWVLKTLTKLALNNNFIERIENLDALVHLTDLNLSFNKIEKIENLEALVRLEVLSVYDNLIPLIENLDHNRELLVLNVGNNLIDDRNNILYLRRFRNLTSFNMRGNPCTEKDPDFLEYVATFLPQIEYYDYMQILDRERESYARKFEAEMRYVERSEVGMMEEAEAEIRQQLEMEQNKESFVEFLSGRYFFDSLFDGDVEGNALLTLGDEGKDFFAELEEQMVKCCEDIFVLGQEQYKLRKDENNAFLECVEEAKLHNQDQSIEFMEQFMTEKNAVILNPLKKYQRDVEHQYMNVDRYKELTLLLSDSFDQLAHKSWKQLMEIEMQLYVQIQECNQTYDRSLNEMINVFVEAAQAIFTQIRTLEQTYTENITEFSVRVLTQATVSGESNWPKEVEWFMTDKDTLLNIIGASHDLHMQKIDAREDTLISRAREWTELCVNNLQKDEIARNRHKVLEINHFFDIQRQEINELLAIEIGPMMDPDVSAALG